jgi:hypothetical protein
MNEEVDQKMKDQPTWNQLSVLVYAGVMTVKKRSRSKLWFKSTYSAVGPLLKLHF